MEKLIGACNLYKNGGERKTSSKVRDIVNVVIQKGNVINDCKCNSWEWNNNSIKCMYKETFYGRHAAQIQQMWHAKTHRTCGTIKQKHAYIV